MLVFLTESPKQAQQGQASGGGGFAPIWGSWHAFNWRGPWPNCLEPWCTVRTAAAHVLSRSLHCWPWAESQPTLLAMSSVTAYTPGSCAESQPTLKAHVLSHSLYSQLMYW